jgi:hypothetical protein
MLAVHSWNRFSEILDIRMTVPGAYDRMTNGNYPVVPKPFPVSQLFSGLIIISL